MSALPALETLEDLAEDVREAAVRLYFARRDLERAEREHAEAVEAWGWARRSGAGPGEVRS